MEIAEIGHNIRREDPGTLRAWIKFGHERWVVKITQIARRGRRVAPGDLVVWVALEHRSEDH